MNKSIVMMTASPERTIQAGPPVHYRQVNMIGDRSLRLDVESLLEILIDTLVRASADSAYAQPQGVAADANAGDLEDVQRTRGGDPDAYRRLIERYQDYVAGILWRFTRDPRDHEELVQDAFVEAYLSLGSYRRAAPFQNWLARIATRVGYRHWKEKARQRKTESFSLEQWDRATEDDGILDALEPDHAATLLFNLFAQLSPRDRLVLTLRYLDQCDVAETAQRTGWTKTMVKVQTLRARKRLQNLVERTGTELIQ